VRDSPSPAEVLASREAVRARLECGITAAQDWCAEGLHTSRRAFQQWEAGDRRMHPAFFELLSIKVSAL
jgi:DNA-binding transcriptional regulator YiaG